jgi:hypothetical protein
MRDNGLGSFPFQRRRLLGLGRNRISWRVWSFAAPTAQTGLSFSRLRLGFSGAPIWRFTRRGCSIRVEALPHGPAQFRSRPVRACSWFHFLVLPSINTTCVVHVRHAQCSNSHRKPTELIFMRSYGILKYFFLTHISPTLKERERPIQQISAFQSIYRASLGIGSRYVLPIGPGYGRTIRITSTIRSSTSPTG